jgi:hypothetical protein
MTVGKTLRDVPALQRVGIILRLFQFGILTKQRFPQTNAAAALMMPNCKERPRPTCDQHQYVQHQHTMNICVHIHHGVASMRMRPANKPAKMVASCPPFGLDSVERHSDSIDATKKAATNSLFQCVPGLVNRSRLHLTHSASLSQAQCTSIRNPHIIFLRVLFASIPWGWQIALHPLPTIGAQHSMGQQAHGGCAYR